MRCSQHIRSAATPSRGQKLRIAQFSQGAFEGRARSEQACHLQKLRIAQFFKETPPTASSSRLRSLPPAAPYAPWRRARNCSGKRISKRTHSARPAHRCHWPSRPTPGPTGSASGRRSSVLYSRIVSLPSNKKNHRLVDMSMSPEEATPYPDPDESADIIEDSIDMAEF